MASRDGQWGCAAIRRISWRQGKMQHPQHPQARRGAVIPAWRTCWTNLWRRMPRRRRLQICHASDSQPQDRPHFSAMLVDAFVQIHGFGYPWFWSNPWFLTCMILYGGRSWHCSRSGPGLSPFPPRAPPGGGGISSACAGCWRTLLPSSWLSLSSVQ